MGSRAARLRVWLPAELNYGSIPGLSTEMVERLTTSRPETLDQARGYRRHSCGALGPLRCGKSPRGGVMTQLEQAAGTACFT